jgi:hypothetical protein
MYQETKCNKNTNEVFSFSDRDPLSSKLSKIGLKSLDSRGELWFSLDSTMRFYGDPML